LSYNRFRLKTVAAEHRLGAGFQGGRRACEHHIIYPLAASILIAGAIAVPGCLTIRRRPAM
jgi:hypothetical protein